MYRLIRNDQSEIRYQHDRFFMEYILAYTNLTFIRCNLHLGRFGPSKRVCLTRIYLLVTVNHILITKESFSNYNTTKSISASTVSRICILPQKRVERYTTEAFAACCFSLASFYCIQYWYTFNISAALTGVTPPTMSYRIQHLFLYGNKPEEPVIPWNQ